MKPEELLRVILPDVLIDNFDIVKFEKSDTRFAIWLDEKKVQLREDKSNAKIIAYGFGDYHVIQDFPIRGPLIFMFASVNGSTTIQGKYSVMIGIYRKMTTPGSMPSSCFF